METVHSVAHLIQPHCYMTSIDLKDAYYSVKTSEEDSKYLKFYAGMMYYQIDCPLVDESSQSSLNHPFHV